MPNTIDWDALKASDPKDRHFLYGVNCYQKAMGWKKPCVILQDVGSAWILIYLDVGPGLTVQKFNPQMSSEEHKVLIISEMQQEGLHKIEEPIIKDGYRTLAFLYSPTRRDFHFPALNKNGKWENKIPFTHVYEQAPEDFGCEDYQLISYYLAPENCPSQQLASWKEDAAYCIEGEHYYLLGLKPADLRGNIITFSKTSEDALLRNPVTLAAKGWLPTPELDCLPPSRPIIYYKPPISSEPPTQK